MSHHHSNIISLPGTPLLQRTVGELVAERPGRSRIFQHAGIDFCCQGGRTLAEACQRRGIAPESLLEQLEAESAENSSNQPNPADLPLHELTRYIVVTHHEFLRQELPRLHAMAARVAQVHGSHTPSLVEVHSVFCRLEAELSQHIMKEEQVLFPIVESISRGETPPVTLDGPISCMIHEHEDAGAALAELRELTHQYEAPGEACNTYRALFAGLFDLEQDLHRHIHLENAVLFPGVQKLIGEAPH